MKSKTYWERRSAERLLDNLKDADKMVNSLKSDYQESILNINESIEKLYGKFATDNVVSYNQAVSLIQGKEYKKWRMSMEKYLEEIAKGDEALSLELNVLCMKKRITRLEAIRAEIYANCGKLARIEEDKATETLTNALERNYYSSMYDYYLDRDKKVLELMHGHQVALSKANIDRVLRMPWSGDNYSKTIWKSKYQIASKLQKAVTRSILEGKSIENLTRDVSTELGNDLKHSVRRLIHTETAYVKSQGDLLTYDKLGVDEYEFLATLDSRTSSICRSLDGEHFKLEDATPGVNYPPMHPYCRSTTIVYVAEKDGTRAARDDEGETYKVDANLNYKDWYKKYVLGENIDKKGYNKNIENNEEIKLDKLKGIFKEDDYKEYLKNISENPNKDIGKLYRNYGDKPSNVRLSDSAYYNPSDNSVNLNINSEYEVSTGLSKFSTAAHEYGHFFDYNIKHDLDYSELDKLSEVIPKSLSPSGKNLSSSSEFMKAIREDKKNLKEIGFEALEKAMQTDDASKAVQDAIDGMFEGAKNRINWGHGETYYNRKYNKISKYAKIFGEDYDDKLIEAYNELGYEIKTKKAMKSLIRDYETASEAWANIMSAETNQGKELEYVKKYLPKSYEALLKIIKEIE